MNNEGEKQMALRHDISDIFEAYSKTKQHSKSILNGKLKKPGNCRTYIYFEPLGQKIGGFQCEGFVVQASMDRKLIVILN